MSLYHRFLNIFIKLYNIRYVEGEGCHSGCVHNRFLVNGADSCRDTIVSSFLFVHRNGAVTWQYRLDAIFQKNPKHFFRTYIDTGDNESFILLYVQPIKDTPKNTIRQQFYTYDVIRLASLLLYLYQKPHGLQLLIL